MILLTLLFFSSNTINFSVDPITYRSSLIMEDTVTHTTTQSEILYHEFNCGIPYHELSYSMLDSTLATRALIVFKMKNINKADSLVDTLKRQFTVPSFKQAAQQQIAFIVQFGLHLPDGVYEYTIDITSGEKQGKVCDTIELSLDDYPMSDILLARQITIDTTGDYLRKGNLQVVPQVSHEFNDRYTHLFVYYELYDLKPDTGDLGITYSIIADDGTTTSTMSQTIRKQYSSQAVNAGLPIAQLDAGSYTLNIKAVDATDSNATWVERTDFRIIRADTGTISYSDMPYYDEIEYFISSKDYKTFLELPDEGKEIFLEKLWSTLDYKTIAARFEYADEHFSEGAKNGSKTDRGRIYIKYGAPDEREKSFLEYQESRPYEHWQYFNGDQFILVDIQGTNEYTLIWTNVPGESKQPTLYKYLPDELRDIVD